MATATPDLDAIAAPGSAARGLLDELDAASLPRHIAVIMDGNGRWAEARGLPRVEGHRAGIRTARSTVETAARLGVEVVTLYAFSTENWKRPRAEVGALMGLLKRHINLELDRFAGHHLQLRRIGRLDQLDPSVRAELRRAEERTAHCTGPVVQIALDYSGRQDLVEMVRAAVEAGRAGELAGDEIDERWVADHLSTRGLPEPDLVIRTSGEHRISNFLLWEIAYSELYFTPVLWPDFTTVELLRALLDYQGRTRRFGGLGAL
jgi:undecaprenyl diphosphate synthase